MGTATCVACGGSGKITRTRSDGSGKTIEDQCRACSGSGKVSTGGDEGWS